MEDSWITVGWKGVFVAAEMQLTQALVISWKKKEPWQRLSGNAKYVQNSPTFLSHTKIFHRALNNFVKDPCSWYPLDIQVFIMLVCQSNILPLNWGFININISFICVIFYSFSNGGMRIIQELLEIRFSDSTPDSLIRICSLTRFPSNSWIH